MASNGKRRPPRPTIELVAPGASPEEAAAIAAALENFLHDTAPAPPSGSPGLSPWARAGLDEGVGGAGTDAWSQRPPWD
jgi:hypothetical protein